MIRQDFCRYLSAKKTVDDRSLNRWVYQTLRTTLAAQTHGRPLAILEIGCGLGTMIERLWDWGLTPRAVYTAIDREAALIAAARLRLQEFAARRGLHFEAQAATLVLSGQGREWQIQLRPEDFFALAVESNPRFDLVLAHAVLDLFDLDESLPRLLSLLRPGGFYYFTLNFDGLTSFQPPYDPEFEAEVLNLYHQSMDRRQGGKGGHSQTGRRLLQGLIQNRTEILAAGSSDWLVWPTAAHTYPAEEAFFLQYILDFIAAALIAQTSFDHDRLKAWLGRRRDQIAAGTLVFLAHQVDVCGRRLDVG